MEVGCGNDGNEVVYSVAKCTLGCNDGERRFCVEYPGNALLALFRFMVKSSCSTIRKESMGLAQSVPECSSVVDEALGSVMFETRLEKTKSCLNGFLVFLSSSILLTSPRKPSFLEL